MFREKPYAALVEPQHVDGTRYVFPRKVRASDPKPVMMVGEPCKESVPAVCGLQDKKLSSNGLICSIQGHTFSPQVTEFKINGISIQSVADLIATGLMGRRVASLEMTGPLDYDLVYQ